MNLMDQQIEGLAQYIHIQKNDFLYRKHKKQKEEDINTCDCKYNANDPESACGESCLNVLTSTECTPGYCPCGIYCKNQRFQKCEYAKLKLFKTEGRGWGVLADESIKAGQFIIEYCGEVISWKEAKRRSQAYENQGLKDAFIISLNGHESIDATKKGSLARFINHSCQPNCETRKLTVLGEIRVGIFSKQDIPAGAELAYDYNFEWYGGAKVRCLCGAAGCSEFLGAKSRGFQEATYLWDDNDERFSVENIPLYDSEEDEPVLKLLKRMDSPDFESNSKEKLGFSLSMDDGLLSAPLVIEPLDSVSMDGAVRAETKIEFSEEKKFHQNVMVSAIQSNNTGQNYYIQESVMSNKRSPHSKGKFKRVPNKEVEIKVVCELLASEEAREEIYNNEEMKKQATTQLGSLYNEIRPAIEEHERDSQDSVSTSLAEKWIAASCSKLKADFDLHSSLIKNLICTPRRERNDVNPATAADDIEMRYLTN